MAFDNASAINGALIDAAYLRRDTYGTYGDKSGVIKANDFKVTALSTPGQGIRIESGVGAVINDYLNDPDETYIVSNPSQYTVPSGDMPASNASARSFIVAIVVGDPDFSQTGHPFMGADDPPDGEEETFEYVRPVLIQVAGTSTTTLSVDYPALVLARIDIPSSTTTITNGMITDLRQLARPRQSQEIFVSPAGTWDSSTNLVRIPSGGSFANWTFSKYAPTVDIPTWAKRAILVASINGVRLTDSSVNVSGNVRTQLGAVSGPAIAFDIPLNSGAVRVNLATAGEYDVSSIAGTNVQILVEGYESVPASPTNNQRLDLRAGSQVVFDVRFFED